MYTINSNLLYRLGLQNLDIAYVFLVIIIVLILIIVFLILLSAKLKRYIKKLESFCVGKDGQSLEDEIISLCEDNKLCKTTVEKNRKDIKNIYKRLEGTYQKMGLVKYDAFQQMGGQLSFSLALLDENNNGFIINSVHSTEGCYSYTKEIKNGVGDVSLGKEEEEALKIALEQ